MEPAAREAAAREIAWAARAKRPRASRSLIAAATIASLACAVGLVLGLTRGGSSSAGGHLDATARATVALDGGGVAVVEPGAAIVWHGAAISQSRGEVFYRIGGALEITSRGQRVRAEAACLRIVIGSSGSTITVEQGRARIGDRVIESGERVSLP